MSANACTQFEDRIHDLMDSRRPVSADPHLKSHAVSCVLCRALLGDYSTLDDMLGANTLAAAANQPSIKQTTSNIGLDDCVTDDRYSNSSQKQNETRHRKAPRHRAPHRSELANGPRERANRINRFNAWTAIASMLLVALTAGLLWQGPRNPDAGMTASVVLTGDREPAESDSLSANAAKTDQPVERSETPKFTAASQGVAENQVVADVSNQSWTEFPEGFHQPLDSYYRISSELPGVHPIRSSVNATFNFFYRSFQPRGKSSSDHDPEQSGQRSGGSHLNHMLCRA